MDQAGAAALPRKAETEGRAASKALRQRNRARPVKVRKPNKAQRENAALRAAALRGRVAKDSAARAALEETVAAKALVDQRTRTSPNGPTASS